MQHKRIALIGDVGGTNIRLQLISIDLHLNTPTALLKEFTYKVADYSVFQTALQNFLADVGSDVYPSVAAIGIAGPITDNTVFMANAEKWGVLEGSKLGLNLKIKDFVFANDFQAASYGVLTLQPDQFISVNGLEANPNKVRAVMGPGTGLGNSVLYPMRVKEGFETIVIPSEGGHVDFPLIDDEAVQYFNFFRKQGAAKAENPFNYISLQRSFCGPSLPYMFRFYLSKHPEQNTNQPTPTPEQIIKLAVGENPPLICQKVLELFIKIYSSAIATFLAGHLTVGGIYLVGSLTNSVLSKLKGRDLFAGFKQRHPEVAKLVENVPIIACKEVELGLRGAFFIAKRIFSKNS